MWHVFCKLPYQFLIKLQLSLSRELLWRVFPGNESTLCGCITWDIRVKIKVLSLHSSTNVARFLCTFSFYRRCQWLVSMFKILFFRHFLFIYFFSPPRVWITLHNCQAKIYKNNSCDQMKTTKCADISFCREAYTCLNSRRCRSCPKVEF